MLDNVSTILERMLPRKQLSIFQGKAAMESSIVYYILPVLIIVVYVCIEYDPVPFLFIIYGVIPLLDELFTYDWQNPTESQRKELEKENLKFEIILYLNMVLDWFIFFKMLSIFTNWEFTFQGTVKFITLMFLMAQLNAVQMLIAHQVFHKPSIWRRIIGTFHMSKNLYMHFTYEHIYGHHRRVATPQDSATSRLNESFYRFFLRTYFGSYRSVFQMEVEAGRPLYLNAAILSIVASLIFISSIYYCLGLKATIMFLVFSFGSIVFLEAANYFQHYGLLRNRVQSGNYEKVTIRHSWNSPHRFTNYILYKVQRHSDHHENSMKPYQTLVSVPESPMLPSGYLTMILMVFFPSVWFNIMNPLVIHYREGGTKDSDVPEHARHMTRIFIVKVGLVSIGLLLIQMLSKWMMASTQML